MTNHIFGLYAQTSIHAGAGSSLGIIDLPIMREKTTGWPCVFGSAMKGALRAKARQKSISNIDSIFGPETTNAQEHAGAIEVNDARLLLLPVRSLTSHFKFVTCPAILYSALDCLERLGHKIDPTIPKPTKEEAVHLGDAGFLYLEEFQFTLSKEDCNGLIKWLSQFFPEDERFKEKLNNQLVIIHDDMFAHLAKRATPVNPHIAIDNNNKTVKSGALWYEETLPPDTILYIPVTANDSRKKDDALKAESIMTSIKEDVLNDYLQVGGNETLGMGWCKIGLYKEGNI